MGGETMHADAMTLERAMLQLIKSKAAKEKADPETIKAANDAWLLRKYIDLVPGQKALVEKYIPVASAADMEDSQKAKDYRRGQYTNSRVINDAEAYLEEKGIIQYTWADRVAHAGRFAWGIEEELEGTRKTVTSYVNPAYTGLNWDQRGEVTRDRSFTMSLYDAAKNQTNPNYDQTRIDDLKQSNDKSSGGSGKPTPPTPTLGAENNGGRGTGLGQIIDPKGDLNPLNVLPNVGDTFLEWLKKWMAEFSVVVDFSMILGGIAMTYFGSYLPTPGSLYVMVPGMGLTLFGGVALYYHVTITNDATDATQTKKKRKLDHMGNAPLKKPKAKE